MSNQQNPFDLIRKFIEKHSVSNKKIFKESFLFIIIAGIVFFLFLYRMLFVYVGPNEYGIKVKQIGMSAGVQKDVYETGLHFLIPTFHTMEILPKDIQILELATNTRQYRSNRNVKTSKPAHIQTSDGFFVDVDCSIMYKIVDPYKVITTLGKKGIYEHSMLPKVVPALKRSLGKLTTEEFYNSPLRVEKMKEAKEILSKEFAYNGLEVMQVFIRYFRYSVEIQKNIEEKKLKDQLVFKNRAEAKAAKEAAILKKIIEEGEANVAVTLAEGAAYKTKRDAEKENYVRKKKATSDLLIKLAESEKMRLRNNALRQGGSDKMVGLEMAKVLKGIDTIILPSDGKNGLNPLNISRTLKMFEVK